MSNILVWLINESHFTAFRKIPIIISVSLKHCVIQVTQDDLSKRGRRQTNRTAGHSIPERRRCLCGDKMIRRLRTINR